MLHWVKRERDLILPIGLFLAMGFWGYQLTSVDSVPDFDHDTVQAKKAAFFAYLEPHIAAINSEIEADRQRLATYAQNGVGIFDQLHYRRLRLQYLNSQEQAEDVLNELLIRVDQVPTSLALVQAAKESGWGSSRFAREGFNFFGQQCFQRGCGFTPKRRSAGLSHEVAKFKDAADAVRAYVHNLNTHRQYDGFRTLRAATRKAGEPLRGSALAAGLEQYSERGMAYVEELRAMIQSNNLE